MNAASARNPSFAPLMGALGAIGAPPVERENAEAHVRAHERAVAREIDPAGALAPRCRVKFAAAVEVVR